MEKVDTSIIYTIGHSTRSIEEFVQILNFYSIQMLVDIRSFPSSRKVPQYNKDNLASVLLSNNIRYSYLNNLGGRRKVHKDSLNTRWHNASFRGYADYMETAEFETGIHALQSIAQKYTTAFMCAEAVWWRCHRSMVSDYLKAKGWTVLHILAAGKIEEHPYTAPARIVGDTVYYSDIDLFHQ